MSPLVKINETLIEVAIYLNMNQLSLFYDKDTKVSHYFFVEVFAQCVCSVGQTFVPSYLPPRAGVLMEIMELAFCDFALVVFCLYALLYGIENLSLFFFKIDLFGNH